MKKIPVYFILPNLSISGVLTFCENAVNHINKKNDKYEASLLIIGSDAGSEICTVPVIRLGENGSTSNHVKTLTEFLNKHEKAVIIPNYMFSLLPALPFLHGGILRLFILHSDEQIYYNTAGLMCSSMDRLICVSSFIRNRLLREEPYSADKVSVIPYGVDVPGKLPQKPLRGITLIYSGRLLEYQKRVSRLAEIVLKLDEKTHDYRFVFMGDGSSAPMLKTQLAEQVSRGNVIFTGRVPRNEISDWLSQSDVFVLTSDFEGTPLALLEAMAYGCVPVVNYIESGIPEVIDEGINGYIIDNCDIDEFVRRITALKDHRETLRKLSENAFAKASAEYSTKVMGDRYIEIFDGFFETERTNQLQKDISEDYYASLFPWLYEKQVRSFIKFFKRIAVFGCGASGKASLAFINSAFPDRCVMMIDDNYGGTFGGLKVVTTDDFLADHADEVDLIVYGAYQKVNPKLIQYLGKPHIRMENII